MEALDASVVLHVRHSLAEGGGGDLYLRSLTGLMEALRDHPRIPFALHLSGPGWRTLARASPPLVEVLAEAARDGEIEVLGGGWNEPALGLLTDRGARWQLDRARRGHEKIIGQKPEGAYLGPAAWDPTVPGLLAREGFKYALVPDGAIGAAGVARAARFVPWLTERDGSTLRLVVIDEAASEAASRGRPAREVVEILAGRAREGATALAVRVAMDAVMWDLGAPGWRRWMGQLLDAIDSAAHWLKPCFPCTLHERQQPHGPLYLPAWMPQDWQECAAGDSPEPVNALSFASFLTRYPEANQLHKRMLVAEREVERIRAAARVGGPDRATLKKLAERATMSLSRAQAAAVYGHGPEEGIYSAAARRAAWAGIAEAEWMVARAMGDDRRLRAETADLDSDGNEEVLVRSPSLAALVRPGQGGVISELQLWDLPGNVMDVVARRSEGYQEALLGESNLPALVLIEDTEDDDSDDFTTAAPGLFVVPTSLSSVEVVDTEGLSDQVIVDQHLRASFVDRFLGPETTLANISRGQHPELGDFVGKPYQIMAAERLQEELYAISLAREGGVRQAESTGIEERLVRVFKRFVFQRSLSVVEAHYEVVNRYHAPIRTCFAIEMNFSHGRGDPLEILTPDGRKLPTDEPAELDRLSQLDLEDRASGLRMRLTSSVPAQIYTYPVECIVRRDGDLGASPQGTCIVLAWPVQLWGEERVRISTALTFQVKRRS